jgi:hypothetical protein
MEGVTLAAAMEVYPFRPTWALPGGEWEGPESGGCRGVTVGIQVSVYPMYSMAINRFLFQVRGDPW